MGNAIIPKRREGSGAPAPDDLKTHEIAISIEDLAMFIKNNAGDIVKLFSGKGDNTKRFKVADAVEDDEAVALGQVAKGLATAWVVFDGSGTILDSFNVSSVTIGSSDANIYFETPMDTNKYVALFWSTHNGLAIYGYGTDKKTTTKCSYNASSNHNSAEHYMGVFFGGKNQ